MSRDVERIGLENYTFSEVPRQVLDENIEVIEDVNMTAYKIGGYETSTFLFTFKMADGNFTVVRPFYVNEDGNVWYMTYQGDANTFDSPKSQSILKEITESIKFLN